MLLARPGRGQLGEQGAHRRALVGKDPDVAESAGERERLGQRAEGAGVIAKPAEPLTDRELEVLRLLAAGRSNQRMAHDLVVALDTVKKHVIHVLGKLGAANRIEAAARAR